MKTRILTILVVLLLASLACQAGSGGANDPNVLFQDDFSTNSSGWDQLSEGNITDYSDGVYRFLVNEANTDIWANPGLSFQDVRIEVEATKAGGPDDNDFGVICRSKDIKEFYFFLISSDGYYGIGKVVGDAQEWIEMDGMNPTDAVKLGAATNTIRADCVGDTLTLYINGEQVAQVQDTTFTSGDVGLIAGTYSEPGTDIHFDNFKVLKP